MIFFLLIVTSVITTGVGAIRFLWRRLESASEHDWIEVATAGAVVGSSLWLAACWSLSLVHQLTRPALLMLTVSFGIAATIYLFRHQRIPRPASVFRRERWRLALFLVPLLIWILFALWRGSVLPPASHDALAYHLPRAVLIAEARGVEHFDAPDPRVNGLPANYELLLASFLLLSNRADDLTEWLSTFWLVLFLCVTALVAGRWWERGWWTLAAVLVTAMTPILLLHSSAHKNDVMSHFFAVGMLFWGAQWCVRGGRVAILLTILCGVLGLGTKLQAGAVAVGLAPFLIRRSVAELRWRRLTLRDLAITAAAAVAILALNGGASYFVASGEAGAPVGLRIASHTAGSNLVFEYGDWANLWRVPYLLLTVPFSSSPSGVWVPWRGEYWFWPEYEIFFSHYGGLYTLLVLALPIAIWRFRRGGSEVIAAERLILTIAAAVGMAVILPVKFRPVGFFAAFTRYMLFVIPVVICWTVPPILKAWSTSKHLRRTTPVLLTALLVLFTQQAYEYAVHDVFAPMRYVLHAAEHRGTRLVWFMPNRAASWVDRVAGPYDMIAIDGSYDTWSYPAWGKGLTRRVLFLDDTATPDTIALTPARWVIVDRSWHAIWGSPKLLTTGDFWRFIGRWKPAEDEVRITRLLASDHRFRLVYHFPQANQAVFMRVDPTVDSASTFKGPPGGRPR